VFGASTPVTAEKLNDKRTSNETIQKIERPRSTSPASLPDKSVRIADSQEDNKENISRSIESKFAKEKVMEENNLELVDKAIGEMASIKFQARIITAFFIVFFYISSIISFDIGVSYTWQFAREWYVTNWRLK
jgi:preprotein translocase subunit SecF